MSQVFQVLKCYKCLVFQVHQTRKDNKWMCKMCGEKQSVKRHYGMGTGKDCRLHVQKLNKMRCEKELAVAAKVDSDDSEYDENDYGVSNKIVSKNIIKDSKWSSYIDKQEETHEANELLKVNERETLLKIQQKRKTHKTFKQSKKFKKATGNEELNDICMYSQLENETESKEEYIVNSCGPSNKDLKTSTIPNDLKVANQINETRRQHETTRQSHKNTPLLQLQTCNRESKWVQFKDTEDNGNENYKSDADEVEKYSNSQSLFSLCDDSEIDTILDL